MIRYGEAVIDLKKQIVLWILCAVFFICAVICCVRFHALDRQYQSDRSYAVVAVEQNAYQEIKDETYVVGAYLAEEGKTAEAASIQKTAEVTLITIDFTLRDLFGVGGELAEGDTDGCILSSELSYALFGSETAADQRLTVGQKTYVVRAVFDSEDMLMFVQTEQKSSAAHTSSQTRQVNGVVLDISDESYRGQYAEEFAGHHGIDNNAYYYYTKDYLQMLPDIILPAKWSDFDVWKTVIEEWQERSERRLYQKKDGIETFYCRISQRRKQILTECASISCICLILCAFAIVPVIRKKFLLFKKNVL